MTIIAQILILLLMFSALIFTTSVNEELQKLECTVWEYDCKTEVKSGKMWCEFICSTSSNFWYSYAEYAGFGIFFTVISGVLWFWRRGFLNWI
ncbi:unnamed protein product [Caenorhabditis angaria]|uniref:Uncharacterized protein n=1 Tax=Caenorhabditis angaria TaxID=860376 RepID=A0A9P1IWS8_9PELO|nr:unnamed protein product [Caenorhabditis angaria]